MRYDRHQSRRTFISTLIAGASTMGTFLSSPSFASTSSSGGERKFVPVMLTPFTDKLEIDFDGLSRLIDFYIAHGAKGFFANCASSEMYALTNDERLALVSHVVQRIGGRYPIVATGSFGDTIEEKADFTKRMYDTGVDAVVFITSHFAAREESDDVLKSNFEKYLHATAPIPLGTYECPSPYKRLLSPELLQHLVATGRLIYHKDTALDQEKVGAKLEAIRGSRLEFYDAHTPNTLYSLRKGARGMSCIAGNFYPEIFAWMCRHFSDEGRVQDAEWLQTELTRADRIISGGYSLSAKYFLNKRGLRLTINSRTKRMPLTSEQCAALDQLAVDVSGWSERLGIG
jgi:4-hydroxy-tetrahydrodipicolinate synthase